MTKDENYKVYIHIVPKELSGYEWDKYYVGITSRDEKVRWGYNGNGYNNKCPHFYSAIQKYGWDNIEHEIIAEHLTKDEAYSMERSLIKELKSNEKPYGYNIAKGGSGGNNKEVKVVKQYDLEGNYIQTFESVADAARHIGKDRSRITSCCQKVRKTNKPYKAYGFMWCYEEDSLDGSRYKRKDQKEILQFDLNGELIREYYLIDDILKENPNFKKNIILQCLSCVHNEVYGYIWIYKDLNIESELKRRIENINVNNIYKIDKNNKVIEVFKSIKDLLDKNPEYKQCNIYTSNTHNKPHYEYLWKLKSDYDENYDYSICFKEYVDKSKKRTYQFDLNGNFLKEYDSIRDAARDVNVGFGTLSKCLNGKQKTCKGFKWSFQKDINFNNV